MAELARGDNAGDFGIRTVDTVEKAIDEPHQAGNKGFDAAMAAIERE